jgi:hypothetical protein
VIQVMMPRQPLLLPLLDAAAICCTGEDGMVAGDGVATMVAGDGADIMVAGEIMAAILLVCSTAYQLLHSTSMLLSSLCNPLTLSISGVCQFQSVSTLM